MVDAPIVDAGGTVVGTVRMWSLGSGFLLAESDNDLKMDSYQAIIEAGIISVIAATVIGYFASRRLLRPIRKITYTAMQIRNGDLTARTGLKGDDEVGRLGETFDGMASELERDIKFEHRLTSDVAHELRTPSCMASTVAIMAMRGVRSSWATSPTRVCGLTSTTAHTTIGSLRRSVPTSSVRRSPTSCQTPCATRQRAGRCL